jgi:hypothetical protein
MKCNDCCFWEKDNEDHDMGACPELFGLALIETENPNGSIATMIYTPDDFGCNKFKRK